MGEKSLESYSTLGDRIDQLVKSYISVAQNRNPSLFTEFLLEGYRRTTLGSVSSKFFDETLYAKVCLGAIITLYDDLADHPAFYNPRLLKELYRLNIGEIPTQVHLSHPDQSYLDLAVFLFDELGRTLKLFPRYEEFLQILIFDIRHVFFANQYAELMTSIPELRNHTESRLFGPYNMGMVAAGMVDLMASPKINVNELGRLRELFILGQRAGRIGNLISTFKREQSEGDLTNEMLLHPRGVSAAESELRAELDQILTKMIQVQPHLEGVDVHGYAQGLTSLYNLHRDLEGII